MKDCTIHYARFKAYHEKNGAWGVLHVVLDDGNTRDCFIPSTIEYAQQMGDKEGEELAKLLLEMSRVQRIKIRDNC